MKLKLFYSLKRKVLAVCLAGMILMALCVGRHQPLDHLTLDYDYEIQNMNHIVDTKATIINDELLRSENVVDYAANSVSREIKDPAKLRDPEFQQRMAEFVDNDSRMPRRTSTSSARTISTTRPRTSRRSGRPRMTAMSISTMSWSGSGMRTAASSRAMCFHLPI